MAFDAREFDVDFITGKPKSFAPKKYKTNDFSDFLFEFTDDEDIEQIKPPEPKQTQAQSQALQEADKTFGLIQQVKNQGGFGGLASGLNRKPGNIIDPKQVEEATTKEVFQRIAQGAGDTGEGFVASLSGAPYKTLKGAKQWMDYNTKRYAEKYPVQAAQMNKMENEALKPEQRKIVSDINKRFRKNVGEFTRNMQIDLPVQQQQRFMTKLGYGIASLPQSFIPGAIALQVYGDSFDQAKAQGKNDDEANNYAATQAILQEASERVGSHMLGKIFKDGGKLMWRAVKGFGSESTQELSQEGLAVIAEKVFGIEPDGPMMQRFFDAWAIGGLTGAGAVAAVTPIQKARKAVIERNKDDLANAVAEGDERKILSLLKEEEKLSKEVFEDQAQQEVAINEEFEKTLPSEEELKAKEGEQIVRPETIKTGTESLGIPGEAPEERTAIPLLEELEEDEGDQELIKKVKKYKTSEDFVESNIGKGLEGSMEHRPTFTGATADNVSQEKSDMGMPGFYDNLRVYKTGDEVSDKQSIKTLLDVKGNPEAEITIYRASPKNELRVGDWVTLSKNYAKEESLQEGTKVHSFKVKAKDVHFAGDSINEFGYFPEKEVQRFTDIWNKAQQVEGRAKKEKPVQNVDFLEEGLEEETEGQISKDEINIIKRAITDGKAGQRIPVINNEGTTVDWIGEKSTFPDWFKNKGWTKKSTLTVIDKYLQDKPLTKKQTVTLDDIVTAYKGGEEYQYAKFLEREAKKEKKIPAQEELFKALDRGNIEIGTYYLANHLLENVDSNFDSNSTIEISGAVKKFTGEELKRLAKDEGLKVKEGDEYYATGETISNFEKDAVKTAVKLYRGHDSDTLIEEWYHRAFDRLSKEDQQLYETYHNESKDTRNVNEHFAQEGRDFFFSEKLHEKAGGIRSLFEKARESLKNLISRVRTLRGANISDDIKALYKKAGTQEAGKGEAEATSYSIKNSDKKEMLKDFGEKIGGARKDIYKNYSKYLDLVSDDDFISKPLSKSWPHLNYEKEIESGNNKKDMSRLHAIRDMVPEKPRVPYKLARWSKNVKTLKEITLKYLNDADFKQKFDSKLSETSNHLQGAIIGKAKLYEEIGHNVNLKNISMTEVFYRKYRSGDDVEENNVWRWEARDGYRKIATTKTREEAIEAIKNHLFKAKESIKKIKFNLYQNRANKFIYIGKKIGADVVQVSQNFKSINEANLYLSENQNLLEEELNKLKQIPDIRNPVNRPRVGQNHLLNKEATPDLFENTFGFRGVEFGNWVKSEERQQNLNEAYNALIDLSTILRIPTQAISLNGELGLAFGARGKGGVDAAKAHYEPGKIVINLTRKEGAGSLGHEWFHAFDNYMARTHGKNDMAFITESNVYNSDLRKEIKEAINNIKNTLRTKTKIRERSLELDKYRSKSYWSTQIEYTARAFENYIVNKLDQIGTVNDYLANYKDSESFISALLSGKKADETYPYLLKSEVKHAVDVFDNLFDILETKKTERGTAFYQLRPAEKPESAHIREIEQEARKIQGRVAAFTKKIGDDVDPDIELLYERARLQLDLKKMKKETTEQVRAAIVSYARRTGLRGEPSNRVDVLVKNADTVRGLEKALDIIDKEVNKRTERHLVAKVIKTIRNEKKRLKGIKGKKRSNVDYTQNQKLDEYIDSLTYTSENKIERLRRSMEHFEKHPEDVIPNDVKKEIVELYKTNIKLMTANQLQEVLNNIESIKKQGKTKYELKEERRRAEIEQAANEAANIINTTHNKEQVTPLEKALKESGPRKLSKTISNMGKKYGWGHIRPERIIEWFSGFKESPLYTHTFKRVIRSENKKLENMERAKKDFDNRYKDIDISEVENKTFKEFEAEFLDPKTGTTFTKKLPFTISNMMWVYANSKNPNNRAHLEGTGLTSQSIETIISALPKKYRDVIDDQISYYDSVQYDRMNKEFSKEHQIDMPKEVDYFPLMNLDSNRAENVVMADLLARLSSRPAAVQKGMTIMRSGAKSAFKRASYFETVANNMLMTEHYIAYNETVREVNAFINNKNVKDAMEAKSAQATREVQDWIKAVAYGKVGSAEGALNKISDFFRTNYVTAVLGLNLVTILKQPASFAQGLNMVKKTNALASATKFMTHPFKTIEFVNSKSTLMRNRAQSWEREVAEIMEKGAAKKILHTQNAKAQFKEISMSGIQFADRATTTILWYAKYQEVISNTGNEHTAIEAADKVIRKTQPMGGINHLASIYRAGGVARAYTMFTNQLNQNLNLMFELQQSWGQKKAKEKASEIFYYAIIPPMLIYLASHGIDLRRMKDDPEGLLAAMISNITGGLMLGNRLIDAFVNKLGNISREARGAKQEKLFSGSVFMPPSLSFFEDTWKTIQSPKLSSVLFTAAKGAGFASPRWARIGIKAGLEKAGLEKPTKATGQVMKRLSEGDPRGFIWSEYALQDMSVSAAMTQRFAKSYSIKDRKKFLEWWSKQGPGTKATFKQKLRTEGFSTSKFNIRMELIKKRVRENRKEQYRAKKRK